MRAAVLQRPGTISVAVIADPNPPGVGEALVRVHQVGVCGTDLHAYRGQQAMIRYPVVLGHELAVEVLELGPHAGDPGVRVGDRCSVIPYDACERCPTCLAGRQNCCPSLRVLGVHVDGGLREQFVLPIRLLIAGADLDNDRLALVEMLAVGSHAVRRAALRSTDTAAIVGLGPIGLGTLAAAHDAGIALVGVDSNPQRLDFARELNWNGPTSGASAETVAVVAAGPELKESVQATFGGELPSVVFDATGNAASMRASTQLVAPGGRVVFVGHTKGALELDNQTIHRNELTIFASRNATRHDFNEVLDRLRRGNSDPRSWITARTDLDGLTRELPAWSEGRTPLVKAMVHLT